MNEFIQKKCPTCGAILTIKNQGGLDNTTVTCPVCHQTYPFTQMKELTQQRPPMPPGGMGGGYQSDPGTQVGGGGPVNRTVGQLQHLGTGQRFRLNMGQNVIGRQCSSSAATIQINTGMNLRMSRQHLSIIVKTDPLGNIVHECTLCKPQCNDTFINGAKLQYGDRVILHNGNKITLPDASLVFIIDDGDATQISHY